MCHQRSSAIEKVPPPPLTYHLSRPLFNLARVLKNNHPGHAPLLPIISLIYPHLSLRFPFLLCLSSISSPFNCHCPCHCFALSKFCFPSLLSCPSCLAFSSCVSLLLIPIFPSLPCLFNRVPPLHMAKSCSLKSQPNLHYPTPSFYPLITHSTPLACPPPHTHTSFHNL